MPKMRMSLRANSMTTSFKGDSKDAEKVEETKLLRQLEDLPLKFSLSNLSQLSKSARRALV